MSISRNRGLMYSDYVMQYVNQWFTDNNNISIYVETFYNCREQGYVLEIRQENNYDDSICIWVYAQRNSDEPTITWERTRIPQEMAGNMFSEDSYYNRTKTFSNVDDAAREAIQIIEREMDK